MDVSEEGIPVENKRKEPRQAVSLPVEIDPDGGMTVDLSNRGLSFETTRPFAVGEKLSVTILLNRSAAEEPMRLQCQAEIVRVEPRPHGYRVGAAVKWLQSMDGLRFDVS